MLAAHERNLFEESVGITVADLAGAHEVFVNGIAIGTGGGFPPSYHNGGQQTFVSVGTLRRWELNEISIRVFLPPDAAASSATPPSS